jgi:hypothetical protein
VQVNRYASPHGCRFGAFGTYRYNWFVAFQPDNTLKIAGPYKYNCSDPTMLQVGIVPDSVAVRLPQAGDTKNCL